MVQKILLSVRVFGKLGSF